MSYPVHLRLQLREGQNAVSAENGRTVAISFAYMHIQQLGNAIQAFRILQFRERKDQIGPLVAGGQIVAGKGIDMG